MQGVDIDEMDQDEKPAEDILTLTGMSAAEAGFGMGFGIGYMEVND